jgi:bis(5'-adenosyl)-triphosphatase
VPHVHIHLIPRHTIDYDGDNDKIYPALEENEGELKSVLRGSTEEQKGDTSAVKSRWQGVEEQDRKPRSVPEMETEAKWLAGLFKT